MLQNRNWHHHPLFASCVWAEVRELNELGRLIRKEVHRDAVGASNDSNVALPSVAYLWDHSQLMKRLRLPKAFLPIPWSLLTKDLLQSCRSTCQEVRNQMAASRGQIVIAYTSNACCVELCIICVSITALTFTPPSRPYDTSHMSSLRIALVAASNLIL